MNINEVFRPGLKTIWMMLLCWASLSAQAGNTITTNVAIIPSNPTGDDDDIFVAIYGTWSNHCIPRDAKLSLSGNMIHIDFPLLPAHTVCAQALQEWGEIIPVQLEQYYPGYTTTYNVIVTQGSTELAQYSFVVKPSNDVSIPTNDTVGGSSTAVNLRRITCKNLTTKKKKIIKNPVGSWNCEASGLIVNPGDRIEQTLIGRAKKLQGP